MCSSMITRIKQQEEIKKDEKNVLGIKNKKKNTPARQPLILLSRILGRRHARGCGRTAEGQTLRPRLLHVEASQSRINLCSEHEQHVHSRRCF
jgi:hypothetical protein